MSQLLFGSVDFSKLLELAKSGNKAFSKAANGKIYLNLNVWVNDEEDQYGNSASIQTNFKAAQKTDRVYIGNFKKGSSDGSPVSSEEIPDSDDLAF